MQFKGEKIRKPLGKQTVGQKNALAECIYGVENFKNSFQELFIEITGDKDFDLEEEVGRKARQPE